MSALARLAVIAMLAAPAAGALAHGAQEPGGKPAPLPANAPRAHLDANRCPAGSVFAVRNLGGHPIVQVFIRPAATTGGFDADLLAGRTLAKGQALDLDPGIGRFDVLILRADGVGFVAPRQDPCRISHIVLTPEGRLQIR